MYGKLGHGDGEGQLVPKEVAGKLGGGKAVMLAAGVSHTMVVTHDGRCGAAAAESTARWVWAKEPGG